jgi:hypothetical protein
MIRQKSFAFIQTKVKGRNNKVEENKERKRKDYGNEQ